MLTLSKPFLGLQGRSLSLAITLCSACVFLLFGYDQGIMGSIISTPYFLEALNIARDDVDTISTVVSIYDIGNMVGCLAAAVWGGKSGRKPAIFIGSIIAIVGAVIQASSYSVAQMIVGRTVTGIGNGINTATIPTWVAETASSRSRGKLVATQLCVAIIGIVIAYWMNYGFYQLDGQIVWRFPIAFQIVFVLFALATIPFLPESPRFLYAKGRNDEADVVLAALKAESVDSEIVQEERAAILAAIAWEDQHGEYNLKTIFHDKSGQQIPKRMGLVILIQVIQEMTGTNIIVNYSSTIFINLGIEGNLALILGGVVMICFLLGSILGIFLIDKIGRKRLLISGTIPVLIGYIVYMIMVKDGGQTQLWVAFGATCVILTAFGWSWLPGAWVLGPELVPVRYRHVGAALNAFSNWTFVFVTVKIGPIGIKNLGWKFYIVFIVMTFLQLPIVYFLYPETQGLSLEEIDKLFVKDGVTSQNMTEKMSKNGNEVKSSSFTHVDRLEAA